MSRLTDGRLTSSTHKPTFSLSFPRPSFHVAILTAHSGWHPAVHASTSRCPPIKPGPHRPLPRSLPPFRRRFGALLSAAMMAPSLPAPQAGPIANRPGVRRQDRPHLGCRERQGDHGPARPWVRIWDAATGTEIAVVRGRGGTVNSAAFSPDGLRIVTA